MNVGELLYLSRWYTDNFGQINSLYNDVISPIQHNASQSNKIPVEEQLEKLLSYLKNMSFDDLSIQQLKTLYDLDVEDLLGPTGADFVASVIRVIDYDPQTAVNRLNEALGKLNEANSGFNSYISATKSLGLDRPDDFLGGDLITVRVGFQDKAAIGNLADWKNSAKDWYDIIRGVAMAAGEAPEDTKVVGATSGSIILVLTATATVTGLLALISKTVTAVAKDVIGILSQIEDLRSKRYLNDVLETELKKLAKERQDNALIEISAAVEGKLPNLAGDEKNALTLSIKKLLKFNEQGGRLDFVAPEPHDAQDDVEGNEHTRTAFDEVRAAIKAYQSVREEVKLLENGVAKRETQ